MVRRHLGYSIDEWEALPWHQQRVHMEGLEWEFYESPDGTEAVDYDDSLDALAQRGFATRTVI